VPAKRFLVRRNVLFIFISTETLCCPRKVRVGEKHHFPPYVLSFFHQNSPPAARPPPACIRVRRSIPRRNTVEDVMGRSPLIPFKDAATVNTTITNFTTTFLAREPPPIMALKIGVHLSTLRKFFTHIM